MTTLLLGSKAIHRKIKIDSLAHIKLKPIFAMLLLAGVLISVLYIFQVNQLTKGSYLVKSYSRELETLGKENRVLQAEFAKAGIMEQVMEKAGGLGLERTSQVKYIKITENSFALNGK